MRDGRPHPRDLPVVLASARAWFSQEDLFRRLVTPRDPDDVLWADPARERQLTIDVSEPEFVGAFAQAYVSGNTHWEMEDKLEKLTAFTHDHLDDPNDPEMHLSSAFHGFIEFHKDRYDDVVREWVRKTRLERPFAMWAKVVVRIEDKWLEHDDVSAGRPVEDGLIEFVGIGTASPKLDELGLFKFIPEHLMRETGKKWPPTETHEIPRHRLLPVETMSLLPREEQDHADMEAYLSLKARAVERDRWYRASFKARKKLEQFKQAARVDLDHYKAAILENFEPGCPKALAGAAMAAEQLALEAMIAKSLKKHLSFAEEPLNYF